MADDQADNTSERLLPQVYDELRKLAAARMANERPGQTISPTGLVHEVWMRLSKDDPAWDSKSHFFGAAAESMRRILIDRARKKAASKHGGEQRRADLDLEQLEFAPDDRLVLLDEALTRFAELEPVKAELVKLRYFAGCSIKDAAELLNISTATADRYWTYSRAWLQREMQS